MKPQIQILQYQPWIINLFLLQLCFWRTQMIWLKLFEQSGPISLLNVVPIRNASAASPF